MNWINDINPIDKAGIVIIAIIAVCITIYQIMRLIINRKN